MEEEKQLQNCASDDSNSEFGGARPQAFKKRIRHAYEIFTQQQSEAASNTNGSMETVNKDETQNGCYNQISVEKTINVSNAIQSLDAVPDDHLSEIKCLIDDYSKANGDAFQVGEIKKEPNMESQNSVHEKVITEIGKINLKDEHNAEIPPISNELIETAIKIKEENEDSRKESNNTIIKEEGEDALKSCLQAMTSCMETNSRDEEPNIRRSGRIKTIAESKRKSRSMLKDKIKKTIRSRILEAVEEAEAKETKSSDSTHFKSLANFDGHNLNEEELQTKLKKDMEDGLSLFKPIVENEYRCERIVCKEAKEMTCECYLSRSDIERGELGCGDYCLNRMLMIECNNHCPVEDHCSNKRFQQHLYSNLHIFRTEKKGFGLFAKSKIEEGDFIMEYVGEVLNGKQFRRRADVYSKDKNKHYYFMALRSDMVIDATAKGNISRFINHSCEPNAETQKWTVNGELRIGFFCIKSIEAGEEITFDYQFQRYGKEAQKCYCESANCRGWIGEEPDSEGDDEEDLDENDDDAETVDTEIVEKVTKKTRKKRQQKEKKIKETGQKEVRVKRKYTRRNKTAIFEDRDLDKEIRELTHSGLKNQIHTLKFSRLMVRAKFHQSKTLLLQILRSGEVPCRRLFLDYHGLKLLHGWMNDAMSLNTLPEIKFRLEILEALDSLPIPNKTLLIESKVLTMVENWSKLHCVEGNETDESVIKNESKPEISEEILSKVRENINSINLDELKQIISANELNEQKKIEQSKDIVDEIIPKTEIENISEEPNDSTILVSEPVKESVTEVQENIETPQEPSESDQIKELSRKIVEICLRLLEVWSILPEIFRIPKKKREELREHEREANKTTEIEEPESTEISLYADRSREFKERERYSSRYDRKTGEIREPRFNNKINLTLPSNLSKQERRQMFEARVAQEEALRKMNNEWRIHEAKCRFFKIDGRRVVPTDIPFCVNPTTGFWFTKDGRQAPTPPSHAHIKVAPPPLSTDINDYILPVMDLPIHWTFSIDSKGRGFYYHEKLKITQWEAPIKILPLLSDGISEILGNKIHPVDTDHGSGNDSSTTDSYDSSEEELDLKLFTARVKIAKKKKNGISNLSEMKEDDLSLGNKPKRNDGGPIEPEDLDIKKFNVEKNVSIFQRPAIFRNRKRKYRQGLVKERLIEPRTEDDKLHALAEMRRYREAKIKLRKRKMEARKRRAQIASDPNAFIPTSEFFMDDSDDEDEEESSNLDNTTMDGEESQDMLVESDEKVVDELDAIKREPRLPGHIANTIKPMNPLNKEMVKRPLEMKQIPKPIKKKKPNEESHEITSDAARRIKDKFRSDIAGVIVQHLGPYRKNNCVEGHITSDDDFKHLARKLTHFVMLKELKHCENSVSVLEVTESVKTKSREFIRKYMAKFGSKYVRPPDEPDFRDLPINM